MDQLKPSRYQYRYRKAFNLPEFFQLRLDCCPVVFPRYNKLGIALIMKALTSRWFLVLSELEYIATKKTEIPETSQLN